MNTKQIKQTEAIVRNEAWAKLTYEQQLADLDRRLGKGIGAKKQRARIQYKIDNPQIEYREKRKRKNEEKIKTMVKVSHELPNNMLHMSREINDYEYCLPHLLDFEVDYLY